MKHLIDKTALVAEIERILSTYTKRYDELAKYEVWITAKEIEHRIQGLKEALSVISSFEVKEVDLEKEIDDYVNVHFSECGDGVLLSDANSMELTLLDVAPMARHFYELGLLKAQKGG